MEGPEKFFLSLIKGFTVEDFREAIARDVDLAEVVKREIPEYIEPFKDMVRLYEVAHPQQRAALSDYQVSAQKVVSWLKLHRPDLGYEIETYRSYPTITKAGFQLVQSAEALPGESATHVGYDWVAKQLRSLTRLLL